MLVEMYWQYFVTGILIWVSIKLGLVVRNNYLKPPQQLEKNKEDEGELH